MLDTLGTGGFAVVKRVRSKMTGENFAAMKIINVTFDQVRAAPTETRRTVDATNLRSIHSGLFGGLFAH